MYLNRTIVMQDVVAFFNIIQKYIKPYKYQWQNFNNLHPKILLIAICKSDIYIICTYMCACYIFVIKTHPFTINIFGVNL